MLDSYSSCTRIAPVFRFSQSCKERYGFVRGVTSFTMDTARPGAQTEGQMQSASAGNLINLISAEEKKLAVTSV